MRYKPFTIPERLNTVHGKSDCRRKAEDNATFILEALDLEAGNGKTINP